MAGDRYSDCLLLPPADFVPPHYFPLPLPEKKVWRLCHTAVASVTLATRPPPLDAYQCADMLFLLHRCTVMQCTNLILLRFPPPVVDRETQINHPSTRPFQFHSTFAAHPNPTHLTVPAVRHSVSYPYTMAACRPSPGIVAGAYQGRPAAPELPAPVRAREGWRRNACTRVW